MKKIPHFSIQEMGFCINKEEIIYILYLRYDPSPLYINIKLLYASKKVC
jgi:hypothetical protein